MIEALKRWLLGRETWEQLEVELAVARAAAERASFWHRKAAEERHAAIALNRDLLDQRSTLLAEADSFRKTNHLLRSLVAILRETNRNLDERLNELESGKAAPPEAEAEA